MITTLDHPEMIEGATRLQRRSRSRRRQDTIGQLRQQLRQEREGAAAQLARVEAQLTDSQKATMQAEAARLAERAEEIRRQQAELEENRRRQREERLRPAKPASRNKVELDDTLPGEPPRTED